MPWATWLTTAFRSRSIERKADMTNKDRPQAKVRRRASRREFLIRASRTASVIAASQFLPVDSLAQIPPLPEIGALTSKVLKPGGQPTLNGVIELSGGPSGGQSRRYFQGWELNDPAAKGVI